MKHIIINKLNTVKSRMASDMFLNLIGSLIPIAVIQLIIFPQLAKNETPENYGLIQSIMAFIYLIGATLGDSLCAARLLHEQEYRIKKLVGDFNLLNLGNILLILSITPVVIFYYYQVHVAYEIFLDCAIIVLSYCYGYFIVRYRLEINYVQILINHIIGAIGCLIGYGVFCLSGAWQFIYIVYYGFRLGHLLPRSPLVKEPFRRTVLFRSVINTCVGLNISTILSKMLTYFDKLILFPILGGYYFSIYVTANLIGKMVAVITTPFTNVILTYLAQRSGVSSRIWHQVLTVGCFMGGVSYFICLWISKPIIYILYPQWAIEVMIYLPVTTASLCFSSYAALLTPFVLKMIDARFQIVINGISLFIYVILVGLCYKEGIMACCVSLLISNIFKVVLLIIIPLLVQRRKDA